MIKERRSQRPEARSAARQAAIKEGKEKRAAAQSAKKAEKAKLLQAAKGNKVKGRKGGGKAGKGIPSCTDSFRASSPP